MKKLLTISLFLAFSTLSFAQVTWTGATTGGDWQVGANWSSGAAPTATDAVVLNTGSADSLILTNIPTTAIAQLTITNNKVRMVNNGAAATITINGGTGTDLAIDATSALIFGGTAAVAANGVINITLATGATAEIFGYVQHTSNTGVSHAHRLQALGNANSLVFKAGSTFACGPTSSGNPFNTGTTYNSSVVFEDNATFIQNGGSNPFASTAPASVVSFATNSNFKVNTSNTISASGRTYGNLEFMAAGYIGSSTAASTFTINGNLTVTAGSPVFTASGASGMVVKGNITVASGATLTFGSATACPVNLTGTTEQTITANGTINFVSTAAATQLILNNAAGAKLGNNLTVTKMTLTNGKFKLGNFNLTATTLSVPILGASGTRFVVTDGTGKLRIPGNAQTCVFPVGASATDNDINQVKIYAPGTETFEVRVAPANAGFTTDFGINRTWDISRVGSVNADELYLGYNTTQAGGSCNPATAMDLGHFSSTLGWEVAVANIVPDNVATTVNDNQLSIFTPISNFSPFSIGTTGQVLLGVELVKFTAKPIENDVTLAWTTVSERDNSHFVVQHSTNGRDFADLGQVKGVGNSTQLVNYSFLHDGAPNGLNYYRLKQFDLDGKSANSAVRSVMVGKNLARVYPTIVQQNLTIETNSEENQTFEIFNIQGQKVLEGELLSRKNIDISALNSGIYFVKIGSQSARFVKQ